MLMLKEIKPTDNKGEYVFDGIRCFHFSENTKTICVANVNKKKIQTLTYEGQLLHSWTTEINGSKLCPLSVRRFDEETIVAITEGWATLWKYPDQTGLIWLQIKLKNDVVSLEYNDFGTPELLNKFGNDEFGFPRDIAVTKRGHFVVTDPGRQRLTIHDKDGRFIRSFGKIGHGRREFSWPYYLCSDNHGRILVSDSHNCCVKVMDEECKDVVATFGVEVLKCGTGVNYSCEKNCIYVGDYDQKSVFQFSCDGQLISTVASGVVGLGLPADVKSTKNHGLIVSEFHQFKIFY